MSDLAKRLVAVMGSRAALAAAAVTDLAVRFGDEALALASRGAGWALPAVADLLGQYGDEALALASLGAGRLLPAVTAWGVFVVGYLRFSPRLYPTLGEPSERPGFRVVVALVTLGFALVFTGTSRLGKGLVVGAGVLVAGSVAFAAYFRWVVGWDLLDPDSQSLVPLSNFFPDDAIRENVRNNLRQSGLQSLVRTGLWIVVFGVFFIFPTVLVATLTVVLQLLFRLPDLLVLTYVVGGPLWPLFPDSVKEVVTTAREVERLFYQPATQMSRHEGVWLGLLVTFGALGSAWIIWLAVENTVEVVSLLVLITPTRLIVAWVRLGQLTVLYAAGCYGLWFWLRVISRLSTFLDREEEAIFAVARPRWLTLPPIGAMLAVVASLTEHPSALVAFTAWPLLLVPLGWLAVDAYRRDIDKTRIDQAARAETISRPHERLVESDAIGLAVSVELIGLWIGGAIESGEPRVAELGAIQIIIILM